MGRLANVDQMQSAVPGGGRIIACLNKPYGRL